METKHDRGSAVLAPPLLVSYSSVEEYLQALPEALRREQGDDIGRLAGQGLPPVVSAHSLAVLFGVSPKFVLAMRKDNRRYYRRFEIKKGKKSRAIQAPRVSLKVIQKWFGHHLAEAVALDDCVFGFVAGKSAVGAANVHADARWVYSVDIADFFPTTRAEAVKEALVASGYTHLGADTIVPLCCYGSVLAQGAPSSPALSNLVMRPVDQQMLKIAERHHAKFTRYADDMVFSGTEAFSDGVREAVKEVFEQTCWSLAGDKEYFADSEKGQRLKVHGLLVHGKKARLTKGYRNKVRAYRHLLRSGRVAAEDVARLSGHVQYAESVDRD